jgi:MHS family proline/betaine transporter-like MFS transporter
MRVLTSLGLVILGTIASYTTLFMPSFAVRQLGIAASYGFTATLIMGIIQLAFVPIFGALSDRIGRLPIMTIAAVLILVGIIPLFILLTRAPSVTTLLAVQACLALAAAAYLGPLSALMSELFPTKTRGTGLSISYSFAVTIFGGFAPFIIAWLIALTQSNLAPSFYLTFGAAASLVALYGARKFGLR